MANYLHIAEPNKFTLPFCDFVRNELGLENHKFLFTTNSLQKSLVKHKNVYYFLSRYREHFFENTKIFYDLCKEADIIYMHGIQFTILFLFFPQFIRKLAWLINGADLYCSLNKSDYNFFDSNKFVLKRTKTYVSHIEGDVVLANKILKNNASFHYATMYLSNMVNTENFKMRNFGGQVKILVGNSNSKNNNHLYIFEKLKKFENEIEYILCPLNYGNDLEYKKTVIESGLKLFGEKFRTLEDFLSMTQYNQVLNDIDIAVFNHWRQEALGVTLSLLSLGKTVYINPQTTTYVSFSNRGFKIFDNNLLFKMGPTINRNVSENKELIEKYYSKDVLVNTLEIVKK